MILGTYFRHTVDGDLIGREIKHDKAVLCTRVFLNISLGVGDVFLIYKGGGRRAYKMTLI